VGRARDSRRYAKHAERCAKYSGQVCRVCGQYKDCFAVLDYHHKVPAEKKHSISRMASRPWDEVRAELDKCVVLCANCHREIHAGYALLEDCE
jgi:hypothetical protein